MKNGSVFLDQGLPGGAWVIHDEQEERLKILAQYGAVEKCLRSLPWTTDEMNSVVGTEVEKFDKSVNPLCYANGDRKQSENFDEFLQAKAKNILVITLLIR